ncbi:type IVB secretion system protein IcmH/DotU [Zooshikella harenae]|uniref:Type IVB secretion system protein IcmH/DotU n=1 Tax=Zooshikella harenae TaxID=2827238 RepID=A0ABS5ZGY8_9GAMM|nr:type IVB secretion system protein IcmH/DotU [Zooshikella harenae]MBU2713336.1 type IVB secretion system protein IcmH/DotU [Zooshikella harenae]
MDGYDSDNADKTVVNFQHGGRPVKPTPGRRSSGAQDVSSYSSYQQAPQSFSQQWQQAQAGELTGVNNLVNSASTLINMAIRLRNLAHHENIQELRSYLVQEIKQFELKNRQRQAPEETINAARYVLCTFLDEIIALTPWGGHAEWSKHSLLSIFHNETWGGEKFFVLLDRLRADGYRHQDLLELMFIIISLGFEGKYRVIERGNVKLEELRDDLYRQLRMVRGDYERELSTQWKGVQDRRNALIRYVPLWVVGALGAVVLLAMYSGFAYFLNEESVALRKDYTSLIDPTAEEFAKDLDLSSTKQEEKNKEEEQQTEETVEDTEEATADSDNKDEG